MPKYLAMILWQGNRLSGSEQCSSQGVEEPTTALPDKMAVKSPLPHLRPRTLPAKRIDIVQEYREALFGRGRQRKRSLQRWYAALCLKVARYICQLVIQDEFLARESNPNSWSIVASSRKSGNLFFLSRLKLGVERDMCSFFSILFL